MTRAIRLPLFTSRQGQPCSCLPMARDTSKAKSWLTFVATRGVSRRLRRLHFRWTCPTTNQPFPDHLSRTIRFRRDETPLRFDGSSRGPFRVSSLSVRLRDPSGWPRCQVLVENWIGRFRNRESASVPPPLLARSRSFESARKLVTAPHRKLSNGPLLGSARSKNVPPRARTKNSWVKS